MRRRCDSPITPGAGSWCGPKPRTHRMRSRPVNGSVAVLAESLAGLAERYPDVAVREIVESGGVGEVLLRWCVDAQLLVAGSHGHGALGRAVLGSTSRDMLHRARCPVMISKVHCDTDTVPDQVVEFGDRYTANVPVRWCNLPRRRR
ncbi:universal stress protein [Rhodococcus sp. NM-2]|jgi:hypothetical protein